MYVEEEIYRGAILSGAAAAGDLFLYRIVILLYINPIHVTTAPLPLCLSGQINNTQTRGIAYT
jgi:hypothetical protein